MGFGDHLIWTAVAGALHEQNPAQRLVVARLPTLEDILEGYLFRHGYTHAEWDVFLNNPVLSYPSEADRLTWRREPLARLVVAGLRLLWRISAGGRAVVERRREALVHWMVKRFGVRRARRFLYLNHPANSYWESSSRRRAIPKQGGHAIQILARNHGVDGELRRPRMYFTADEIEEVRGIHNLECEYLVVEPHHTDRFTPNKVWPYSYWQALVEQIRGICAVVQIGVGGGRVLDGVVDLTGRTTFRQAAILLRHSRLLVCAEGGLAHAAAAVDIPAIVIYGGFISPRLMGYADHVNLFTELWCSPCGLRESCPIGLECMRRITPERVAAEVRSALARELPHRPVGMSGARS